MKSLSSIGLGLSLVFACLLLALVAEIYYLLWWKRRIIRREIENDYRNNPAREFMYMFCWKKKSPTILSSSVNPTNTPQTQQSDSYPDFQFHAQNKDYWPKPFDENGIEFETQLITGPPRFLFTIKEETREDLESEDGKSRKGKGSLSDLLKRIETPYLTPLSSPPFLTPPLTPMGSSSCHSTHSGGGGGGSGGGGDGGGYNPFCEASSDAEFNKIIKASPPPKFKFLRDAEEKLERKIMLMEEAKRKAVDLPKDEQNQDGSFITVIIGERKESDKPNHHYHSPHFHSSSSSSSSQSTVSHNSLNPYQ